MSTRHRPRHRPRRLDPQPPATRLRRRLVVLLALAVGLVLPVLVPSPAQAVSKWNVGTVQYSTIVNCPSLVLGTPYQEYGVGTYSGYWGSPGETPTVGQTTYFSSYTARLGSHCSTPVIFPRFVLPAGVVFDTTEAIRCSYTRPGPGETIQVTDPTECPQWANVDASGRYTNSVSGWYGGWPLPSGNNWSNGSAWEFHVPIKVTAPQSGSTLRTELKVVDGNSSPTLTPEVKLYAPAAAEVPDVPGAPTGVSTTAASPTSAKVSFTAPADNGGATITGYDAQCSSPDGGVTVTRTASGSPVTVTGLSAGKQYRCRVRAENSAGEGAWSSYSSTVTLPATATVPGVPRNLTLTEVSSTQLRATFDPPVSDGGSPITGYFVQCWEEGVNDVPAGLYEGSATSHTFDGLTPGHAYRCRVLAYNAVGDGPWTAFTPYFTLGAEVPAAPTGTSAVATSATAAKVSFTAPTDDGGAALTGYNARCDATDGDGMALAIVGSAATSATVTGLSAGTQYRCQVRARNRVGWGAWSTPSAAFTTPVAPTDTTAPDTRIATAVPAYPTDAPVIDFDSPDADTTGYECRLDNAAWAACTSPYRAPAKAGSHRLQVRAVDGAGNVDASPATTTWTTPADDRTLRRHRKWAAQKGAAYYRRTALTTSRKAAALTTRKKVRVREIALVATTCRTCGKVAVHYGKKRVATVNLKSARTRHQQVLVVRSWGALQKRQPIRIVVLTRGKRVTIDGLGLRTR